MPDNDNYLEKLDVNDKLEIRVKSGPYEGTYNSKVTDIKENEICVLAPSRQGEVLPLRENLFIEVFFTDKTAAFKFFSRILERRKGSIPQLVLEIPSEIKRIQRRDYFRLEITIDAQFCRLDEEKDPIEEYQPTKVLDISGGGVKMKVPEDRIEDRIKEDTKLRIKLDIPELEDVPLKGKVVQSYTLENNVKAVGIEFLDLNSKLRDKVVGWIFDKQREMRQKGLI